MDLLHWEDGSRDPFQEFEALQNEINRLFDVTRVPDPRASSRALFLRPRI